MPRAALALLLCSSLLVGAVRHSPLRHISDPDEPLPPLSEAAVRQHSVALAGQPRRTVVATFSDFKAGTTQAAMVTSWVRNMAHLKLPCVVGVCAAGPLPRSAVEALLLEQHCAVLQVDEEACVINPKVCRGYQAKRLAGWDLDLFYTDADVALLRNPLAYFSGLFFKHPSVDLATASDSNTGVYSADDLIPREYSPPAPTIWQASFPWLPVKQGYVMRRELPAMAGLEGFLNKTLSGYFDIGLEGPGNCMPHQFNTGVMYVRATPGSVAVLDLWIGRLEQDKNNRNADDQLPLNNILKAGAQFCSAGGAPARTCDDPRVNAVAGGLACFGLLNLAQFTNGFTYAMGRNYEGFGVEPFTYHATYTQHKVFSLQEQGGFFDDEAHYTKDKFLTFDLVLDASALHPGHAAEDAPQGFYTWEKNYAFVQVQLRQLKVALALAQATGRVLILPRFAVLCQCFFYRPEHCVISGHRVRLPHVVPTAHVLRVEAAPNVREPDFLARAPARVRASQVKASVGDVGSHAAAAVVHLRGIDLLAAFAADAGSMGWVDTSRVSDDILGSWCCLKATDFPEVAERLGLGGDADVRVRYAWEGPPEMVRPSKEVGRCAV